MRKLISAALAAAALSSFGGVAQADGHEQRKSYIAPVGDRTVICSSETNPGIGGDCFNVTGGSTVNVLVLDSINTETAGFNVGFYGEAGRIGDLLPGCQSKDFSVPEGATFMRVFVGVLNSSANCETPLNSSLTSFGEIIVGPAAGTGV